ncbi:MAG: DMT family transporter [Dehalobacterium sp.]
MVGKAAALNVKGLGFVLAILSAIAWGTNGSFCIALSNLGLSTANIAILAPAFNLIFFFFLLLFRNPKAFKVSGKMLFFLLADGVMSSVTNISFVNSVKYFPVGIVSTLIFCNTFVIMILSRIVFKHKITLGKIFAAMISLFSVGLVLNVFHHGFDFNHLGLLWIASSIIFWSFMVIIEKYLLENGVDGNAILFYMAFFAVIILSISSPPWTLFSNIYSASTNTGGLALLVVLGYGMIPQVGSYFFYIKGLKYIEPSYVQVAFSLDPVTASILGFIFFGQSLEISQIFGILLILIVVGYIQFKESQKDKSPGMSPGA